jgi:Holliday junction resolvase RusA-like endonuclease
VRLIVAPYQRPDPKVGKDFGTGAARNRNTDAYAAWKDLAAMLVRASWAGRPKLTPGPVHLEVVFVLAPPKKKAAELAGLWCDKRPDLDRYVHAIQDAITDAGNVWFDDNQVARLTADKRYCHVGEPPSIVVEVSSLS